MFGLHNIFLIAPPPSSFNQQIPNSHQITNINDQCNISNNNQYSWANLKKYQEEQYFARKDGDDNEIGSSSCRVCRDCGNRAKKECEFRRCRTCCKGRGFDCATHVKSTWVPAARRREKSGADGGGGSGGAGTSGSSSGSGNKRPRETMTTTSNSFSNSNSNAAFNFDPGSNSQDANFKQSLPSQVRAPAVFRCIRVTAINGGEAEVAYQAMVNISGHVFKGFLYDQGIDENNMNPSISNMPSNGRNRNSTSPTVNPPESYPASANQRLLQGND